MAVFTRRHSLVPATTPVVRVSHGIEPAVTIPRTLTGRRREVVFVGRLVGWKGVIAAVDAFARARVGDARLVFIGDGSDRSMIEKRVRSRGLTDRVEFTGPLDRPVVLERMRHAACLLFPSFHDSAGFVVSEALSLGLPVVCLDHGGPGELVRSWPDIPSDAVPVSTLDETINRLAVAIERFVEDLVPIPPEIAVASTTLSSTLAHVYRMALDPAGTDHVDGVM
jgi:glycosyltransferase involved in cell wall biosynthesis